MSEQPPNIIRRQLMEVDVEGSEYDGMALQHSLPEMCDRLVTPSLDRALARSAPRDGWLLVERLDLDLGTMALDELERDLPEAIGRAVESFFRQHPPSPPSSSLPEGTTAGNVQRRTHRETVDGALLFFLRTGRLPWSFRLPHGRSLEEVVLSTWTATDGSRTPPRPGRRAAMLDALSDARARRRLIRQFSPAFRSSLLRWLSDAAAATVDTCLTSLGDLAIGGQAGALFVERLWEVALVDVSADEPPGPRDLLAAAWQAVASDTSDRAALEAVLERRWPGIVGRVGPEVMPPAGRGDPSIESALPPRRPVESHTADGDGIDDGIYVENAGTVLLHPFLPRCFGALGIAAGDELTRPDRALGLLHHLATGEVTAPEHELVLAKVLCNIAIDEPVAAVVLDDHETAEAAALLEAVIRYWDALRGTGPDALRTTFLMRSGKLSRDHDGDWMLRVEVQGFDVLVDQLPWTISMIQLPWMRRMLRVEWR